MKEMLRARDVRVEVAKGCHVKPSRLEMTETIAKRCSHEKMACLLQDRDSPVTEILLEYMTIDWG